MDYQRLSKRALGCMYTAEIIGNVAVLIIIGLINYYWLIPRNIQIGRAISTALVVFCVVRMFVRPYFRYNRYRYSINSECIDIREGYIFVERQIVPIERLHKLSMEKGPIDRIFKVAKVNVTTAGGDAVIRFLDEEKAEKIAENLKDIINDIAKGNKKTDGEYGEQSY